MKKTLLLVFIHGFKVSKALLPHSRPSTQTPADRFRTTKGGESTFGDDYQFTRDLRDNLAKELPKIDVKVLVYPKYETRGDLGDCVARFSDWYFGPFSLK